MCGESLTIENTFGVNEDLLLLTVSILKYIFNGIKKRLDI